MLMLSNRSFPEENRYTQVTIYLPTLMPWARVSRLRVENFNLMPPHACGPISHARLKNASCCRLARHNFQKHVNLNSCKEQKPCVKWINDNTFLAISYFLSEKHWERARIYTCFKTGNGKCEACFCFRHIWMSSEDFWLLQEYSEMIKSSFKNPSTPRIKISRLYFRKSWQV